MGAGEIAALACALAWACAVILFKKVGSVLPAFHLNLFKNVFGSLAFLLTLLVLGRGRLEGFDFSAQEWALLVVSGVVGITIADGMLLRCLDLLGAGRMAVVDCLYTPCMMLATAVFLQEDLRPQHFVGVILIVAAVLVAGLETDKESARSKQILGVWLGVGSMILMAVCIVMVRPIMREDHSNVVALISFRLWVSSIAGFLWLFFRGRLGELRIFRTRLPWRDLLLGSFLGAYLGMALWVFGFALSPDETVVAAILNQSSVLFIIVLAVLFLGENLTLRKTVGAVLGIAGIVVTLASGN